MKRLPLAIVGLILFLALFFNLERFNYISYNMVNIQGFVYLLATAQVSLVILSPLLRRMSYLGLIILSTAIYLLCRLSFYSTEEWWGGIQTYVTIAEIVMLSISIILARLLGGWLDDFVDAVENITFAHLKRVHTLEEVENDIEGEMYRSRRYQHPLTVVVAKLNVDSLRMAIHRTVEEVQRAMLVRYVSVSLMTRALYGQLRRTDWLLEHSRKNQFIFILPETKGNRSDIVMERIQQTAEELGVSVACGIATFPDDALTFDGLLAKAEESMPILTSISTQVLTEINASNKNNE